jgi:hypothetical protein
MYLCSPSTPVIIQLKLLQAKFMSLSAILLVTTGQLLDSDSVQAYFDGIVLGANDT